MEWHKKLINCYNWNSSDVIDILFKLGRLYYINLNFVHLQRAKWVTWRKLTAFPGCVARAARKAAILSVVPVQTAQSFGNPCRKFEYLVLIFLCASDMFQERKHGQRSNHWSENLRPFAAYYMHLSTIYLIWCVIEKEKMDCSRRNRFPSYHLLRKLDTKPHTLLANGLKNQETSSNC